MALNGQPVRRTYREFAQRAAALGYYLRNRSFKRVGILATNTPAFLESIFGIAGAGAVNVGKFCQQFITYDQTDLESDKLPPQRKGHQIHP